MDFHKGMLHRIYKITSTGNNAILNGKEGQLTDFIPFELDLNENETLFMGHYMVVIFINKERITQRNNEDIYQFINRVRRTDQLIQQFIKCK